MKKDSFIIALCCTLLTVGLLFVLVFFDPDLLHHLAYFLLLSAFVCFISVYVTYYFIVHKKLKAIASILSTDPSLEDIFLKNVSLKKVESLIKNLLQERKEELEKIKKLENHRREFLGNVSHEMKTPLFHIQGYVSTLVEQAVYDPELHKHYLERTEKSIERLINVLKDLDTISQLETSEITEEMEPFDMVELVRDVLESEETDAKKKSISLVLLNEAEKMPVMGNRFRIRQVLANLIVNSIRYGQKENGKTEVRITNNGNSVRVEVKDNGIGMAAEHLSRIFERFYRIDKGRSREQGGTGLGLSIVKHILEAHHQTINVSSTSGAGSTFSFHLKKAIHYSSFSA